MHFICQILEPIIRCPIFGERQDSNQPYASGMMRVKNKVYNHLTTQANGSIAIINHHQLTSQCIFGASAKTKTLMPHFVGLFLIYCLNPRLALEGNRRLINCALLVHGTAKSSNFLTFEQVIMATTTKMNLIGIVNQMETPEQMLKMD